MSEIDAMGAIDKALHGLGADERKRVLRWAIDKFGGGEVKLAGGSGTAGLGNGSEGGGDTPEYQRISDLMDAASPKSTVDHVLVASYWFQVIQGKEDFTAQEVNAELKDLGQASKNITDSYSTLMNRKPPAARQVQKTGSSRQGRKKYRLTEPGIRGVQKMLKGESDE